MIVAQRILGTLAVRRGDYAIGQASLEASLGLARRLGVPWWTAETLVSLGEAALEQGDLEQARRYLAEGLHWALVAYLRNGDRRNVDALMRDIAALADVTHDVGLEWVRSSSRSSSTHSMANSTVL